jgi:hypothetical protein
LRYRLRLLGAIGAIAWGLSGVAASDSPLNLM